MRAPHNRVDTLPLSTRPPPVILVGQWVYRIGKDGVPVNTRIERIASAFTLAFCSARFQHGC